MINYLLLLGGAACAGFGGDLFVRGVVGLAAWARISTAVVATTLAAFATSSPEVLVAIIAGLSKTPEISFGNVLGSNVVNVALVLGSALAISQIPVGRETLRRDFPTAAAVPLLVGLLGLDGWISTLDGIMLLMIFASWVVMVVRDIHRSRSNQAVEITPHPWKHFAFLAVGFALLATAGRLIVSGGTGLAAVWGIPEFVVGATVVAIGTTTPELATAIISKLKGHDDIGVGTILGSNIFNGLFIIGLLAVLCPIQLEPRTAAVALLFGVVTTIFTYPRNTGIIERGRSIWLLLLYVGYVLSVLWT